jgi:hypothetical protein
MKKITNKNRGRGTKEEQAGEYDQSTLYACIKML